MGPPPSREQQIFDRVFILGGKGCSEDEWRETFGQYGTVTNVWITKDRNTGEEKGITYITYTKTSEACLAVEEMNGKTMPGGGRPLKVILASDKREGSKRSVDEDKMLLRLFIVVPKSCSENDIEDHFSQFGELEYVRIIRDRRTGSSKGLAYVKYSRQYHGAKAFEECDKKYRAIFADVKPKEDDRDYDGGRGSYSVKRDRDYSAPALGGRDVARGYDVSYDGGYDGGRGGIRDLRDVKYGMRDPEPYANTSAGPIDMLRNYSHWDECRIEALVPDILNQEHVYRLFDLIPGLQACGLDKTSGIAYIEYATAQCAAYAKDKIHGMEYPPGYRISVRFPVGSRQNQQVSSSAPDSFGNTAAQINQSLAGISAGGTNVSENLQTLVDSIQKATQVLQSSGISAPINITVGQENVRWCNIPLPVKKPFAPKDAPAAERLFIVSGPDTFADYILEDALCRFGDLISAHFMPGKTFGYAKFASKHSADDAIKVLHGQQICGNRLKVMLADPPKYERDDYNDVPIKRPRHSIME